jgi:hypothetical protein
VNRRGRTQGVALRKGDNTLLTPVKSANRKLLEIHAVPPNKMNASIEGNLRRGDFQRLRVVSFTA